MNQNAALSRWLYYCKRRPSKFRRQHGITHLPRSLKSDSAEKPYVHPSRNLRTNGAAVEIIGDFSVRAEPGRSIPMFFSRITITTKINLIARQEPPNAITSY